MEKIQRLTLSIIDENKINELGEILLKEFGPEFILIGQSLESVYAKKMTFRKNFHLEELVKGKSEFLKNDEKIILIIGQNCCIIFTNICVYLMSGFGMPGIYYNSASENPCRGDETDREFDYWRWNCWDLMHYYYEGLKRNEWNGISSARFSSRSANKRLEKKYLPFIAGDILCFGSYDYFYHPQSWYDNNDLNQKTNEINGFLGFATDNKGNPFYGFIDDFPKNKKIESLGEIIHEFFIALVKENSLQFKHKMLPEIRTTLIDNINYSDQLFKSFDENQKLFDKDELLNMVKLYEYVGKQEKVVNDSKRVFENKNDEEIILISDDYLQFHLSLKEKLIALFQLASKLIEYKKEDDLLRFSFIYNKLENLGIFTKEYERNLLSSVQSISKNLSDINYSMNDLAKVLQKMKGSLDYLEISLSADLNDILNILEKKLT